LRTKPSAYFIGGGGTVGSAEEVGVWAAARAGMRETRKSEKRILNTLLSPTSKVENVNEIRNTELLMLKTSIGGGGNEVYILRTPDILKRG
jgi:hypothetical protein